MDLLGEEELFRLPQTFHHTAPGCLTVHDGRNEPAQKGKYRNGSQHRNAGDPGSEEPEHVFQQRACQRIHPDGEYQGNEGRTESVEKTFADQHGFQLAVCHAHCLQHGKFPSAGKDSCHDGVEKIQNAHKSDDGTEQSAQQQEHMSEIFKFFADGCFALVHDFGEISGSQVREEFLCICFCGSIRCVKKVKQGNHLLSAVLLKGFDGKNQAIPKD